MNKANNFLLILISFITCFGYCYSQNISEDQKAIEMLREFYFIQSTIKSTPQNIDKMDSLQKKYCTVKLQKKMIEQFNLTGLDHDLLTNDYGIDSLGIKTLSISKEPKHNNFVVSYIIWDDVVPNVSRKKVKVILKVTVRREDGFLKLDSIN